VQFNKNDEKFTRNKVQAKVMQKHQVL